MQAEVIYICPNCSARHGYFPYRGICLRCENKYSRDEWNKIESKAKVKKEYPGDRQLRSLTALVTTLRGTPGSRLKKEFLYEHLKENPFLEKWFRLTYDEDWRFLRFTSDDLPKQGTYGTDNIRDLVAKCKKKTIGRKLAAASWKMIMQRVGKPFDETMEGIIDGNLKIGLAKSGVNKVFKRLKWKPLR